MKTFHPLLCALLCTLPAAAELADFEIDATRSSLSLSGKVRTRVGFFDVEVPVIEQAPGSLSTHYAGTIHTDLELDTIHVLPTSRLFAEDNGLWLPGLPSPFDYNTVLSTPTAGCYGGRLDGSGVGLGNIELALREITLMLDSVFGFSIDENGRFPTSNWIGATVGGYASSSSGSPPTVNAFPYSNPTQSFGLGRFERTALEETLTLPLSFFVVVPGTYNFEATFSGTIVAVRPVPEPSAACLALVAWPALIRRRRAA
jgi:hypothetical protein